MPAAVGETLPRPFLLKVGALAAAECSCNKSAFRAGQMAVYGTGDEWSSEVVFYDCTPRTEDARIEDADAELLDEYPDLPRVTFSTLASFRVECKNHWSGLINGQGCPYKAYIGVTPEDFQAIDSLRESRNCTLPRISLLYDKSEGSMVVKFMVGLAHESAGQLFGQTFDRHLTPQLLDLLTPTGSTRFTSLAGRSKESDVSYKPISRILDTDWPSMVVEVGVSESLKMLQADLRFWLRESGGRTRVAILLHVNNNLHTIRIERWEVYPRIRPARPGVTYGPSVRPTQTILLDAHVQYNGPGLLIPTALVFDVLPPSVRPGQFVLSARELDNFNNRFWSNRGVVPRR